MLLLKLFLSILSCVGYANDLSSDLKSFHENKKIENIQYKDSSNKSLMSFKNIGYVSYGSSENFDFVLDFSFINASELFIDISNSNNIFSLEKHYFKADDNFGNFLIDYQNKKDSFVCTFNFYDLNQSGIKDLIESKKIFCSCYNELLIFSDKSFEVNDLEYSAYKHNLEKNSMEVRRAAAPLKASTKYTSTITLNVCWKDAAGNNHPAYALYVEMLSDTGLFGMYETICSGYLNENGRFIVNCTYSSNIKVKFKIFLKSQAAWPLNPFDNHYETEPQEIGYGQPKVFPTYYIGNSTDKDKKINIVQAFSWAHKYLESKLGQAVRPITYSFPCNGTFYIPILEIIDLEDNDYCDWDVIMHEYGHFVEDYLDLEDGSGGDHHSYDSLSEVREDLEDGVTTAWSEGFATYFAMSCQNELGLKTLNIISQSGKNENGDSTYTDITYGDSGFITNEYNFKNSSDVTTKGEGCERTLCTYLLGLADSDIVPSIKDDFNYGYLEIWNVIVENRCKCLSDFVVKFHERHQEDFAKLGDFEAYLCLGPSIVKTTKFDFKNTKFEWTVWNANGIFPQNRFVLYFYNDKYGKILNTSIISIEKGSNYSYTPSNEELKALFNSGSETIYWRVEAFSIYDGYETKRFYSNVDSFKFESLFRLSPINYGFEQQYYFYQKSKTIIINEYKIKTNRIRTGFIEGEYIVLSANRSGAGTAFLELEFDRKVKAIRIDACLWSGKENFGINDTIKLQSFNKTTSMWKNEFNFLRDIVLSVNRSSPNKINIMFDEPIDKIKILVDCYMPSGDRNKGRLCIGDLYVY